MHANPRQPLGYLRVVAPRHGNDLCPRLPDIDSKINGVRSEHIAVMHRQDHRNLARTQYRLVRGKFWREGVRNVDQIGHSTDGVGNVQMIVVDPHKRINRQRRAKQKVRLKIPNRLPEGRHKFERELRTALADRLTARQAEQLEFIWADPGGSFLLGQPQPAGRLSTPEVGPGSGVCAYQDPPAEVLSELAPPQFKRAGGGELEIVEMSVNK